MNYDKVYKVLENARDKLSMTEINLQNYNEDDVIALNEASTAAWWAIRDALAIIDQSCEAPAYDHYWQIVLNWAYDMNIIKKLSIHEMHTLTERLQSITANVLSANSKGHSGRESEEGKDTRLATKQMLGAGCHDECGDLPEEEL